MCQQTGDQAAQIAIIATMLGVEIAPGVTIADAVAVAICGPS